MTGSGHRGTALVDVNVLVALAWPNHQGHAAARDWFASESERGWATTPVTETGFVRVSSNRGALTTATSPARAVDMLARLTAQPGHTFWNDGTSLVTAGHLDLAGLTGHRQVTDAHLLALCLTHGGRLVTFDRGLTELAADKPHLLHLLHPGDTGGRAAQPGQGHGREP